MVSGSDSGTRGGPRDISPARGRGRGGPNRGRGRGARGRGARGRGKSSPPRELVSMGNGIVGTPPDKRIGTMKDRDSFTGHSTLPSSNGLGSASSLERLMGSEGEGDLPEEIAGADNINVVVRSRPLNPKEINEGDEYAVRFPGEGQVYVEMGPGQKNKTFTYNVVFEPESTQEDVLEHSGVKKLVEMALDGFNCTIFCYGQTGSGKTHTLTGPPNLFKANPNPFAEGHGLVFRSFVHLFQQVGNKKECQFVLRASFLEIYNEKVIDLLNPGTARKPLAVRWSKKSRGFFVENLFTVECQELDDLLAVLEEGLRNRAVGSHNMNEYSSRSHTILTVYITSEQQASEEGVFISRHGKLNFVDLAGSEMTKKTQSEGKTLEEANNINKSLMVLGYCIASLSDPKKRNGHIPYRDSKLTKLLADSLAGNGVTLMIACVSPARSNISETLNTLRYAARAKRIRTKPVIVMDPREALILSLKREVNTLRNENEHLRNLLDVKPSGAPLGIAGAPALLSLATRVGTPPSADLDKLRQLESDKLADMVHDYLVENETLRKEASELASVRDVLLRDQELVCRENERLLKKLEDVNSVCIRSPIAPVRPTYSAEMLNLSLAASPERPPDRPSSVGSPMTNVWTNSEAPATTKLKDLLGGPRSPSRLGRTPPYSASNGSAPGTSSGTANAPHRLPDSVRKEMDKRLIGKSMNNIADSYREKAHRRQNSWEGSRDSGDATPPLPPVKGKRVPTTPE